MPSLYGRLFKYSQRSTRSPKEDFLTEALAGLLEIVIRHHSPEIIKQLFVPDALKDAWDKSSASINSLHIDTQPWIDENSRPDIVVYGDGNPLIVIENKISARFQDNQLNRYRDWLRTKTIFGWPGLVCLLTHTTDPPADFLDWTNDAPHALVRRWGEIASQLRSFGKQADTSQIRNGLSGELLGFLVEENMAGEFAEIEDFSAAFVYLRSSAKMSHTFETIFKHIKQYGGFFAGDFQDDYELWQDTSLNAIWGWKFLKCDGLKDSFLGYGISLKPSLSLKGNGVPEEDSAFICLGSDNEREFSRIQDGISRLKLDWTAARGEGASAAWVFSPLSSYLAKPDVFSGKMIAWLDRARPDIERLIAVGAQPKL